jgi:hypothetical protein
MFRNKQNIISKIMSVILVSIFTSPVLAATYEKTESDYGHKIIYLRGYEIVAKQGIHYQTKKPFQYKEGYLIYSETSTGIATQRKAACLADICNKWTNDPKSFKRYEDKRAKVKTDERLDNNNEFEECIMEMKIIK